MDGRKFGFDLERVAFAMTLQRLMAPGSDLQGSGWTETAVGLSEIALRHLYRTNGFLGENREELEKALFARDRDLFSQELDVVFLDTTSIAIHRDEETEWRKRGYSRDHRPDLPQMVLSIAVDGKGWPVSWEVFPGNTADPVAFEAMITKLRTRFRVGHVVVVADRGMMGKKSLKLLSSSYGSPRCGPPGVPGSRSEAAVRGDDMRLSQPTVVPKYFSSPVIRSFTESSKNQLSKMSQSRAGAAPGNCGSAPTDPVRDLSSSSLSSTQFPFHGQRALPDAATGAAASGSSSFNGPRANPPAQRRLSGRGG